MNVKSSLLHNIEVCEHLKGVFINSLDVHKYF